MSSLERRIARRQEKAMRAYAKSIDHVFRNFLRSTPPPPALSHVTGTTSALESILRSGTIWASRSLAVRGDEDELVLGEELVLRVVRTLLEDERRPVARSALEDIVQSYAKERISAKAKVYIACFTPSIEEIHWDTYGSSRRGYAFTLNMREHRRPIDPEVELALVPVVYDAQLMEDRLRGAIARALDLTENLLPDQHIRATGKLRPLLLRLAAVTAVQTKHQRFAGESEWRIVAVPEDAADHRIISDPIEHVVVEINPPGRPDLREVRIGPQCPNPDAEVARLRRFLSETGYSEQCVVRVG